MSESSTRISKFYNPTDSEHKLHKTRIENWLSIGFELEFPEPIVITTTPCSTYNMMGSLKVLYTHLQSLVLILETFTFTTLPLNFYYKTTTTTTTNCARALKIHSQHPSIKFQQKQTTVCLIICKHSKHTELCYHACCCVGLGGRNSRNKK